MNESDTRAIRALLGKSSDRTHRLTVVAVVDVLDEVTRIEVEAPRVVGIARIRHRGPVEAIRAGVVEAQVVAEAGRRKENTPIRVITLARD